MSGIAGMLIESGLQTSNDTPDIGGSLMKGAQLAEQVEKTKQMRADLEKKKQDQELAKFAKVGEWYNTAASMPDGPAKKAFIKNFIPNGIKALGVHDKIDPTVMEMMQGDPQLANFIEQKIRDGDVDMGILSDTAGVAKLAADPAFAQFGGAEAIKRTVEAESKRLNETQDKRTQQEATRENAIIGANAQMNQQIQAQNATGDVEDRKKTGALFSAYTASGGASGTQVRIKKLQEAINALKNNTIKMGTIGKKVPYGSSMEVLARTDEKAKALVDSVRSSINVKLRSGDPNPTQQQIDNIYAQAIDPRLSNAENIKKLEDEILAEKLADKNARKKFIQTGFMPPDKSYTVRGKTVDADFIRQAPQNVFEKIAAELKKTPAELKKELGIE